MNKRNLNLRDIAIVRGMWIINTEERDRLDHFFLVHDSWKNLEPDFYTDDQEIKRFLKHDGREYEVILMSPVRQLKVAAELGLSFRVNVASNLRVVLIKEWQAPRTESPDPEATLPPK